MYDKRILAKSTGASLGVVAVVGMLFLSTGTAFAMPVSGIGGFIIQADEIRGNDMVMYPGQGDAENHENYPQAVVELSGTEIDNMRLIKVFHLSEYGLSGNARLVISAGDENHSVSSEALLMKTPALSAESATFSGMVIDEEHVPDDEKDEESLRRMITLRAPAEPTEEELPGGARTIDLDGGSNPGLTMQNARIRATYLATNEITLPNLGLEVQYDANGDGDYTDEGDWS